MIQTNTEYFIEYEVEKFFKKIYSYSINVNNLKGKKVLFFTFVTNKKKDLNHTLMTLIKKLRRANLNNNICKLQLLEKEIFNTILPVVKRTVNKSLWFLKEESIKDDCIQEALIKFYINIDKYSEDKGKIITWLHTIVLNVCRDYSRKKSNTIENSADALNADNEIKSEIDLEKNIIEYYDKKMIHKAITLLPDEQREIITLKFFEKMPLRQIGERLHKPHTTIHNYLNQALEKLKKTLESWEN